MELSANVTGKPVFEYFPTNLEEFDRFHRAMTNLSAMAVSAALEAYDFSPFRTIVDVGGAMALRFARFSRSTRIWTASCLT